MHQPSQLAQSHSCSMYSVHSVGIGSCPLSKNPEIHHRPLGGDCPLSTAPYGTSVVS